MRIEGGNNPKSILHVDQRGRAKTIAQTETNDRLANREGQVWSVYFSVTPTASNYFFYYKNDSTQNVNITDIRAVSSAVNKIYYRAVSGTPTPTGAVTEQVTTRLVGDSTPIEATIVAAASIAGLADDGVLFFESFAAANKREKLSSTSNIIIPQGKAVAFFADQSTALEFVVSVVKEVQA